MFKIRKSIFTMALLLECGGVFAQSASMVDADRYKVETNRFWSNWFVGVGGGAQVYFGDHNKQMNLGHRLSPALDITAGKWFTPGIGMRIMYSGLSFKGATQNGSHSTGEVFDASQKLYKQKFNFYNLHADALFNVTNMFCGYKENRFYNLSPYVGLGWMVTWQSPEAREVSANIGLLNSFRLSSAFDFNVDVRGSMVNDRFDGEVGGRKQEGPLSVTLGFTYKFKQRGWSRSEKSKFSDTDYNALLGSLDNAKRYNGQLSDSLANLKVQTNTITNTITKTVVASLLVIFDINKSQLSEATRVNINFFAQKIKKNSSTNYIITGYADNATGNKERNDILSKERAQAVYDCLTKEFGVSASQLKMDYKGGVNNMYYDNPTLSRSTIVKAE